MWARNEIRLASNIREHIKLLIHSYSGNRVVFHLRDTEVEKYSLSYMTTLYRIKRE
jgi:hypothetical protein